MFCVFGWPNRLIRIFLIVTETPSKPNHPRAMQSRLKRAFSLVELLVVVAVIGIVATFAVPAVQGMLKGSSLTSASSALVDQMSLARQHALSKNRLVEVRFYRFADPEMPGEKVEDPSTGHFRGLQFFEMAESGILMPVSKMTMLPDTIIMNPGEVLSNFLGEDAATKLVTMSGIDTKVDPELPRGVRHRYEYMPFRFFPDGTTSLSPTGTPGRPSAGGRWFITVHSIADLARTNGNAVPPPNFFTWMIDPVAGSSKIFRPGLN
jgi:uncharacterized protein (TIGR02596 family)